MGDFSATEGCVRTHVLRVGLMVWFVALSCRFVHLAFVYPIEQVS